MTVDQEHECAKGTHQSQSQGGEDRVGTAFVYYLARVPGVHRYSDGRGPPGLLARDALDVLTVAKEDIKLCEKPKLPSILRRIVPGMLVCLIRSVSQTWYGAKGPTPRSSVSPLVMKSNVRVVQGEVAKGTRKR